MGYVIVSIVVLLLVAGFVTFFVLNATKKGGPAAPEDPGAEGTPPGIAAPDDSPLGDTSQHAGDHERGHTTDEPERHAPGEREGARPRVGDPGPEAGAAEAKAPQPESERLADRSR